MDKACNHQGAALITALFIMALIAAAAVLMELMQRLNIQRSEQSFSSQQASLYATGIDAWAKGVLYGNANKKSLNSRIDNTPVFLEKTHYDNIIVSGKISDMQGLFNLNNLMQPEYIPNLTRLLLVADSTLQERKALAIAKATHQWVSSKRATATVIATPRRRDSANNSLAKFYLSLRPPYQQAHTPMVSPSEFRLIAGVDQKLYNRVSPYLTALPEITKININTASAPVIASLNQTLSPRKANAIVAARKGKAFSSIRDFMALPLLSQTKIDLDKVTLNSEYFLVNATMQLPNYHLQHYSLLHRKINSQVGAKKVKVNELWHSRGSW